MSMEYSRVSKHTEQTTRYPRLAAGLAYSRLLNILLDKLGLLHNDNPEGLSGGSRILRKSITQFLIGDILA